ncbi:hypothetical protein ABTX71_34205 [Streptomyces parvulus]|uniref:hypothetical protein n=1 Tax=Streptomyces parvulus TaxID=146923 RepID=UPI00331702A0
MSETSTITKVSSQYAAQVAGDLERNTQEQERIGTQINALQEQLTALQHDHSVLLNIQQAVASAASASATENAATLASRRKAVEPGSGKGSRARKSAAPARNTATKKPKAKKAPASKTAAKAAASKSASPTLVELVRRHLSAQSEPRSAAEVFAALSQSHPSRSVQATVVRNTLEGLVAKNQARRTKQGASVYYASASTPQPSAASGPATQAEETA